MYKLFAFLLISLLVLACSNNNGKIIITDTDAFGKKGNQVFLENVSNDTKITFTVKKDILIKKFKKWAGGSEFKLEKTEEKFKTKTYTLNPGERELLGYTDDWVVPPPGDERYEYEYIYSIVGELKE